jgi:NAD(P)-dependent dehydrogenase (short-subunit alcohol dehydrogenase family)
MTGHPFPLLEGQLAVITGAGSGIGRALALGLSDMGAAVVVAGRTRDTLDPVVAEIAGRGHRAWGKTVDVADPASCVAMARRVAAYGDVSILVNNAGVIRYATLDHPDIQDAWDQTIGINLGGPFNMVRSLLAPLKATRGAVVNIASIAASIYTHNTVGYSASKGGVSALTMAMSRELGGFGIRVNAVAPGVIATGMAPSAADADRRAITERRIALGRVGQPEDMVGPVAFLSSSMARYVTGTTLLADGGYLTG